MLYELGAKRLTENHTLEGTTSFIDSAGTDIAELGLLASSMTPLHYVATRNETLTAPRCCLSYETGDHGMGTKIFDFMV